MKTIQVPTQIDHQLRQGAALAVSVSGGKDSQAMLTALVALYAERGYRGPILAIHADLGRIEWPQTPGHVAHTAAQAGVRLVVVRRRNGEGRWDMISRWEDRGAQLVAQGKQGRPWSDAANRFCTSDLKRDPINIRLRAYTRVISAEGIRASESKRRAAKPAWEIRTRIHNSRRDAFTWNPIQDWTDQDVWEALGTSVQDLARRRALYAAGDVDAALRDWQAHPAYVMGNERLSCALCVLGCQSDIENGIRHNPETARTLIAIEQQYGFAFQNGRSLESVARTLGVVA